MENDAELVNKLAFELWEELCFTADIFEWIIDQSNVYANQEKNDQDFQMTLKDLGQFIGILVLSGYHWRPEERDYWPDQPDLEVNFFLSVMY